MMRAQPEGRGAGLQPSRRHPPCPQAYPCPGTHASTEDLKSHEHLCLSLLESAGRTKQVSTNCHNLGWHLWLQIRSERGKQAPPPRMLKRSGKAADLPFTARPNPRLPAGQRRHTGKPFALGEKSYSLIWEEKQTQQSRH